MIFLFYIVLTLNSLSCINTGITKKASPQNVDYLIDEGKLLWEQRSNLSSLDKANHMNNAQLTLN